jgi:hypothetical protein
MGQNNRRAVFFIRWVLYSRCWLFCAGISAPLNDHVDAFLFVGCFIRVADCSTRAFRLRSMTALMLFYSLLHFCRVVLKIDSSFRDLLFSIIFYSLLNTLIMHRENIILQILLILSKKLLTRRI